MKKICRFADASTLGNAFCENLRRHHYVVDYIVGRVEKRPLLAPILPLYKSLFEPYRRIKNDYIRPKYMFLCLNTIYNVVEEAMRQHMTENYTDVLNENLVKLAVSSVQYYNTMRSQKYVKNNECNFSIIG